MYVWYNYVYKFRYQWEWPVATLTTGKKSQHFDNQVTTANICYKVETTICRRTDLKKPLTGRHWNLSTWPVPEALHILQQCGEAPRREIETTIAMNDLEYFWRLDGDTMEWHRGFIANFNFFFGFANAQCGLPSAGWYLVLGPRLKACWSTLKLTTPRWRLLWVGGFWHSWCLLVLWFETFGKIQLIWIHKWVR